MSKAGTRHPGTPRVARPTLRGPGKSIRWSAASVDAGKRPCERPRGISWCG